MTTTTDRKPKGRQQQHEGRYARAADAATDTIDSAPLAVLAGGIAIGALAGALIPRSTREKELLAPVGRQLNQRATAAVAAAREAGKEEFAGLGLTKGAAKHQAKSLLQGVAKAVTTAGTAAARQVSTKT